MATITPFDIVITRADEKAINRLANRHIGFAPYVFPVGVVITAVALGFLMAGPFRAYIPRDLDRIVLVVAIVPLSLLLGYVGDRWTASRTDTYDPRYRLKADERGVIVESEQAEIVHPWPAVKEVVDDGSYLFVMFGRTTGLAVPKRSFQSPADANAFAAVVRSGIQDPPARQRLQTSFLDVEPASTDDVAFDAFVKRRIGPIRFLPQASGFLVVGFFVLTFVFMESYFRSTPWLGVSAIVVTAVVALVATRLSKRMIDARFDPKSERDRVSIVKDGIAVDNALERTLLYWKAFRDVIVTKAHVFVMHGHTSGFIVPRRCFATQADMDAFVSEVRTHIPTRAF